MIRRILLGLIFLPMFIGHTLAEEKRAPVILDTDIGSAIVGD